ncbi:hypothetical protein C8R46DRAFT_496821 [Mycena filopes]|nr:hypothetical protein C8R46DRAFT_496821 [Mycena filopes]
MFCRLAPPCLCCVFVPRAPTTRSFPVYPVGKPLSSIPYILSGETPFPTIHFSTRSTHDFTASGFKLRARWLSSDLLQKVDSASWCRSKNLKTHLFPTGSHSVPNSAWRTALAASAIWACPSGNPRSADSRRNWTSDHSFAGETFCFFAFDSRILAPPLTRRFSVAYATLCFFAIALIESFFPKLAGFVCSSS